MAALAHTPCTCRTANLIFISMGMHTANDAGFVGE